MSVSIIPFKMPEPMEIPSHIVDRLREMSGNEAVAYGMELLLQIDAADIILYERVGEGKTLELGEVVGPEAATLKELLVEGGEYDKPLDETNSLTRKAFADESALLVMGNAEAGEQELPADLLKFLLAGAEEGNVGFLYVLPMNGADGRPLGTLTLMRPAAAGPLNHEQPNISEAMRQELSGILDG